MKYIKYTLGLPLLLFLTLNFLVIIPIALVFHSFDSSSMSATDCLNYIKELWE